MTSTTRVGSGGRVDPEDAVTFDEFVAARSPALLRTAYLLTHDHALAEDLLQTALTKASDSETTVRLASVHHRVAAVRRRRRAVGAGALALVVLAGVGALLLPRAAREDLPAAPTVIGQKAPTTLHSLGYTYRTDGTAESGTRRVGVVVKRSDQPQLYSWAADEATEVKVHVPTGEVWDSVYAHFGDFVVVPPGTSGRLTAMVAGGHVAVARYTLTDVAPPGYTRDGVTFRETVAGRDLLGAVIAAPAATEASTTVVLPKGETEVTTLCTGVPQGYAFRTTINGSPVGGGDCSDPSSFDPGAAGGYVQKRLAPPGQPAVVRIYLTRGVRSPTPVTGDFPHLRLGVGLYGPDAMADHLAGNTVGTFVEHGGHTWSGGSSYRREAGQELTVPGAAVDLVAMMVWGTHETVRASFHADGMPAQGGFFATGSPGGMGDLWVPADAVVHARVDHGKGPFAVNFYQRDDLVRSD
jgi:hypothetical protein